MTAVVDLVDMIRETSAQLTKAEARIAEHGPLVSLKLSAVSLRHRLQDLEARFAEASAEAGLDVCDYRLMAGHHQRFPISALAAAMIEFQSFITVMYDAIKLGVRKDHASVRAETAREAELDFGYAYPGSLGFVFTIPRATEEDQLSKLDAAVAQFFEITNATTKDQIAAFVKQYGSAPVRIVERWAQAHLSANLSAEIEWRRSTQALHRRAIEQSDLLRLSEIISAAGEPVIDYVEVFGKLVAGNLNSGTFQIDIDGKEPVRGKLHKEFRTSGVEMALGRTYTARVERTVRPVTAKGGSQTTYALMALTPAVLGNGGD